MSTIEEIEAAIEHLPRDQFFRLLTWLRGRFEDEWDREFETDVKAGKLGRFASEAFAEYRAGRTKAHEPKLP